VGHRSIKADHAAVREAALDRLMVAVSDVHLTPVRDVTLLQTAARLLNDALADYELSELGDSIKRLSEDDRLQRDRSGRILPQSGGRSPLRTARAFAAARESAGIVSDYEPPYDLDAENTCGRRVLSHKLLTARQERRLAQRTAIGNRAAINQMVVSNARLAWSQTRSFAPTPAGAMDRDDYFQEACLGLIRAAEKFDPGRGFRFSTYAVAWINQATRRAQANLGRVIRIPVHVYDDVRNVRAVIVHQERDLGSTPLPDEIGRVIAMPPAEVTRLLELSEPIASLDAEPDLLANLESCAADSPELTLSELELLEILDSTLSERDRQIVSLRFGIGENREHTLEEVGRRLGVTRERVRQIQSAALDQIRPLVKEVLAGR